MLCLTARFAQSLFILFITGSDFMKVTAIILAAGSGSRMKMNERKQWLKLDGISVISRTVKAFEVCDNIESIVIVARADEVELAKKELSSFKKIKKIIAGGLVRLESAKIGFESIDWDFDYVAIHDGARCFVTSEIINSVCHDAEKYGAATASNIVTDTVKRIDENLNIVETIDRNVLVCVQTPQIFKKEIYERAISNIDVADDSITDDNMLAERIGVPVHCTQTGKNNIKITFQEDLLLAKSLLNGEFND